jgi:hypothetical protein
MMIASLNAEIGSPRPMESQVGPYSPASEGRASAESDPYAPLTELESPHP